MIALLLTYKTYTIFANKKCQNCHRLERNRKMREMGKKRVREENKIEIERKEVIKIKKK
jgi:hypothetical protein